MVTKITENSYISIGLLVTLVALTFFVATTYQKVEQTRDDVAQISVRISRLEDFLLTKKVGEK